MPCLSLGLGGGFGLSSFESKPRPFIKWALILGPSPDQVLKRRLKPGPKKAGARVGLGLAWFMSTHGYSILN